MLNFFYMLNCTNFPDEVLMTILSKKLLYFKSIREGNKHLK